MAFFPNLEHLDKWLDVLPAGTECPVHP